MSQLVLGGLWRWRSWACSPGPPSPRGGRPVAEVRGHGSFQSAVGAPPETALDKISINAWLDEAGVPHGTLAWTSVSHGVLPPGPGATGYPWDLAVTGLLIVNNQEFIEAFVVSSPQAPQDVGILAFFTVVDSGNASGIPDEIGVFSKESRGGDLLLFEPKDLVG